MSSSAGLSQRAAGVVGEPRLQPEQREQLPPIQELQHQVEHLRVLEVAVERHHTRVVAVGQQVTLADGVAGLVLRDEVALGPATNDER